MKITYQLQICEGRSCRAWRVAKDKEDNCLSLVDEYEAEDVVQLVRHRADKVHEVVRAGKHRDALEVQPRDLPLGSAERQQGWQRARAVAYDIRSGRSEVPSVRVQVVYRKVTLAVRLRRLLQPLRHRAVVPSSLDLASQHREVVEDEFLQVNLRDRLSYEVDLDCRSELSHRCD